MLPEEVAKFIDKAGDVTILEVEKGAVRRFADAVDDPNPLYGDEEYAKNSKYGSIIAPPGFFGWPSKWKGGSSSSPVTGDLRPALARAGYNAGSLIDAGTEYTFFCPIRVGDTLAALPRVVVITEREGKLGKMAFVITETTYTNQNGDLVAKARGTLIYR